MSDSVGITAGLGLIVSMTQLIADTLRKRLKQFERLWVKFPAQSASTYRYMSLRVPITIRKGRGWPQKRGPERRQGEGDAASAGLDQNLVKALSHSLRVRILAVLNDRVASPNMLSKELEEGLSQVSYHVKVLKDYDCIEMVKTEPRRGAVEHFYRAKQRAFVPTWLAKAMPKSTQFAMVNDVLGEIDQDLKTSLEQGTFYRRRDLVVARDPQVFDAKACEDAEELAAEFVERYGELGIETATRLQMGKATSRSRSLPYY